MRPADAPSGCCRKSSDLTTRCSRFHSLPNTSLNSKDRSRRCRRLSRIDLLVAGSVIVELKAVDALAPIHEAQLLSYLKLSGNQVGLLLNFNVIHLREGIKRIVSNYIESSPRSSASSAVKP